MFHFFGFFLVNEGYVIAGNCDGKFSKTLKSVNPERRGNPSFIGFQVKILPSKYGIGLGFSVFLQKL